MHISSGHGLDTIFRESCSSGVDLTKLVVSAEGIECDATGTGGAAKYKPRFLQSKKGRQVIATAKGVVVVVVVVWGARAKERKRLRADYRRCNAGDDDVING